MANINRIEQEIQYKRIAWRWRMFIDSKESTDLWTEEDFLLFLNNEDAILNYTLVSDGEKVFLIAGMPEIQKLYKAKLDRLREIYEDRFKETETVKETEYTAGQKFLLLVELGFLDQQVFKANIPEANKHKVIAKILGCDIRTAKALYNSEPKYQPTPDNKDKVLKFIKDNNLK